MTRACGRVKSSHSLGNDIAIAAENAPHLWREAGWKYEKFIHVTALYPRAVSRCAQEQNVYEIGAA